MILEQICTLFWKEIDDMRGQLYRATQGSGFTDQDREFCVKMLQNLVDRVYEEIPSESRRIYDLEKPIVANVYSIGYNLNVIWNVNISKYPHPTEFPLGGE